jgi:predicted metal-binding protein
MMLVCVDCEKATTTIEANARLINTARCGYCGGELVPQRPVEPLREVEKSDA